MTDYYGLFVQICHLASLLHSHLGLTRACMDTKTPSVELSLEFKDDIELIQYLNSRNSEINTALIILGQGLGGSSYLYAAEHFSHLIVALILVGISVYNFTTVVGPDDDTSSVRNPPVVACLRSLPLHFLDWWHRQTHMSQTQDFFLAIEAKWNTVCPGQQPSLPLGLWPRWTVIKQGCAESAPHISMPPCAHYYLFMPLSSGFFSQQRSEPYVCFCTYTSRHM